YLLFLLAVFAHGQTLRQWAAMRNVQFGAGGLNPPDISDAATFPVLPREFTQIEPGNAMKFGPIHPSQSTYNFGPADDIANYAAANKQKLRGHVFVWHS